MPDEALQPLIDVEHRLTLIERVLAEIEARYIFPHVAAAMIEAIQRKRSDGEYDAIDSGVDLAQTLTADLQEISGDRHLQVRYSTQSQEVSDGTLYEDAAWIETYLIEAVNDNFGVHRVERLSGNIGYLQLTSLDEAEYTAEAVAAAMALLANTRALIIDIRRNSGGAPTGVAFLCSYLFPSDPIHLNDVYCRQGDTVQQYWTLPYVPGKRYVDRPVYVLTSAKTPSAAEELAYDLQTLGRATIVGDTTVGAANPVELYQLTPQFAVQLPTCQAINPITRTNWEGVGVVPDIAVRQEDALLTAHREALKAVLASLKDEHTAPVRALSEEINGALESLRADAAG